MTPRPKRKPRNNAFFEKAVVGLWMAREALADFLTVHEDDAQGEQEEQREEQRERAGHSKPEAAADDEDGQDQTERLYPSCSGCDCPTWDSVRGVVFMLQTGEMLLQTDMYSMPRDLLALRAGGFPYADQLAEIVKAARDAEADAADEDGEGAADA